MTGERPPEHSRFDADAEVVRGEDPPSVRVPLDRDRILGAAVSWIDEFGLAGLSMRRLGTALGVEAMALYHHVNGREDLLDGVVEAILEEMDVDKDVLRRPQAGWQDFLQRLAHGVRRIAITHPQVFPLVASRPTAAPWLRPPLRSLDWVEVFLSGLTEEGFSDAAATAAYRAFSSFLLGHLLLEVSTLGADVGPLDVVADDGDDERSLTAFPTVRRLSDGLAQDHSAAEFEEALEDLLNRLELVRQEL